MYSTVKELHIEIEQRIQQITSNRHRSIAPQFIDMVLNRAAVKYIQSKSNRKTNYKGEGFEDSKKRVDDFQSLKRETSWLKVKKVRDDSDYPNRAFVVLPGDYLRLIGSTSRYTFGKPNFIPNLHETIPIKDSDSGDSELSESKFKNAWYYIIDLSKIGAREDVQKGHIKVNDTTVDITDILKLCITDSNDLDLYEIASLICDRLRDKISPFVYWQDVMGRYYKDCIVITSDKKLTVEFSIADSPIETLTYNQTFDEFVRVGDKFSDNDLVSSETIRATINNFYANRHRYLNPMSEIIGDRLYVYYDDNFCIDAVKVAYIKKPRLFNIDIGQMSDMEITPEFMDNVVSDILLILKDNSFSAVKQQSNFE